MQCDNCYRLFKRKSFFFNLNCRSIGPYTYLAFIFFIFFSKSVPDKDKSRKSPQTHRIVYRVIAKVRDIFYCFIKHLC